MRYLLVAVFAGCVLLSSDSLRSEDAIRWNESFRDACDQAARERKLVLLHFWDDGCRPCKEVDKNVFSQADVAEAMDRSYVPVKVYVKESPDIARRYQVRQWPTDVIVTPSGLEVYRTVTPQNPSVYVDMLNEQAAAKGGLLAQTKKVAGNLKDMAKNASQEATGAGKDLQKGWNDFLKSRSKAATDEVQKAQDNVKGELERTKQQFAAGKRQVEAQLEQQADDIGQKVESVSSEAGQMLTNPAYAKNARGRTAPVQKRYANNEGAADAESTTEEASTAPTQEEVTNRFFKKGGSMPSRTADRQSQPAPPNESESRGDMEPSDEVDSKALTQRGAATQRDKVARDESADTRQSPPQTQRKSKAQKYPLALEGYCPVTMYRDREWVAGDKRFGAIHRERTYLFANEQLRDEFMQDPDKFSPMLSSYDPVIFYENEKLVDGVRDFGVFFNNRMYFFATKESCDRFVEDLRSKQKIYPTAAFQAMRQYDSERGVIRR